jgi:hypothetical protein
MPAGRPSKYSDEICRKARLYVSGGYKDKGDAIPQIAGLAVEIGISRDTVYEWSQDPEKQEFSDIVAECMSAQERKLINGSLTGDLNPTISKLLLCKHGHSERIHTEHSGGIDMSSVADDELERRIREMERKLNGRKE